MFVPLFIDIEEIIAIILAIAFGVLIYLTLMFTLTRISTA
jgi:hypothetical protein